MSIIQRLSEIKNLPTLPEIALRIQELIMSEEGDAALLSRIIEQDPALTAKILKVANSSFYCSINGHISSVNLAITRIGFNEIGHIALAVNFIRQFSHHSNVLEYKKFWKHALTAGYLCSLIAERKTGNFFAPDARHSLFLAGLLHDTGILLYDQFFHDHFDKIITEALGKEIPFLVAEKKIVPNETHGIIGSALLERWKFDRAVVSAVRFHHEPDQAPQNYRRFVFTVYLAEHYLCNMILGSFEGSMDTVHTSVLDELNLSHEIMVELLQEAEAEVDHSDLVSAMENDFSVTRLKTI